MSLNRRFSPFSLLIISMNGMVGSAWLFAPFYAAKLAGPTAIIAWLIAGAATALIALTFAELSVLMPVAGGTAQIPQLSHGTLTSFILGWTAWISSLTMAPIEVQAVLQYASVYFPSLTIVTSGVAVLTVWGYLGATLLMMFLCFINIASFKGLVRFNFIIFLFKVSVIVLTIYYLIKVNFHPGNFIVSASATGSIDGWKAILTAVASGGIAFAFTGFKHGVELAGETKRPALSIPLAVVGSVVGCLLLYIGLQVAFIGALDSTAFKDGWHNLVFSGDVGPFAGLAGALGLIFLMKLLYADAVVSPLGAGLIYATSTARVLYAMSKIGYLPKFLSGLNKQQLPVAAIWANFAIGMLVFLPLPGWQAMVSFLVSAMVLSYAVGPISLLCLRLELPNEKRAFRLPAAKFLCLLAFYFCNLINYWTGWETISKLMIAIGVGIVVFLVAVLRGKLKHHHSLNIRSGLWMIPYLSGLAIISYLGAFGGKQVIPFGWDFVVIGIFSIVTLYLAVRSRTSTLSVDYADYRLVDATV